MHFLASVLAQILAKNREKKKPVKWLISEIMNEPERFMLVAYIENDELVMKVRKKDVGHVRTKEMAESGDCGRVCI